MWWRKSNKAQNAHTGRGPAPGDVFVVRVDADRVAVAQVIYSGDIRGIFTTLVVSFERLLVVDPQEEEILAACAGSVELVANVKGLEMTPVLSAAVPPSLALTSDSGIAFLFAVEPVSMDTFAAAVRSASGPVWDAKALADMIPATSPGADFLPAGYFREGTSEHRDRIEAAELIDSITWFDEDGIGEDGKRVIDFGDRGDR